jgi:ribosomal protein S27AE
MPKQKCPKCGKSIDSLTEDRTQHAIYKYNGDDIYEFRDYGDIENQNFHCPECDALLFTNEEDAKNFLDRQTTN